MSQLSFLYIKSSKSSWEQEALKTYTKKISGFKNFELKEIKSGSASRNERNRKIEADDLALLKNIDPSDYVIIFDENGKSFKDSEDFSKNLVKAMELGKSKIVFLIGGAYGFGEAVKARANQKLSLSDLTMNHHVAQIMALEQIYRALTIWKGIPYHNS